MPPPFLYSAESSPVWKSVGGTIKHVVLASGECIPVFAKSTFGFSHAQLFVHGLPAHLPNDLEQQRELIHILERNYTRVSLVDFDKKIVAPPSVWKRSNAITHLVDIAPTYEPPDPDLRSELRKSQREGLIIRKVATFEEIERARMLFLHQGKHSNRLYPRELFSALAQASLSHDDIIWLIAHHDEQIIASQIFLQIDTTLLYWLSVMDRSAAAFKPAVALLHAGIQIGIELGATRCNLGSSPPDASGLVEFKKRWGAREYEYPIYSRAPSWWPG